MHSKARKITVTYYVLFINEFSEFSELGELEKANVDLFASQKTPH
jgi:hypothetical protein